MFEIIHNKLFSLINFGELKLPSFLLNVSPSFIAPVKLVKCQTTNDNFDLVQQQYDKSHSTQQLILPLMIKILNQFIKMIDLKTNPNMTVSSNYSKLICSIEYMNDKRFLMSPGTHSTLTTAKNASSSAGGSPMGISIDCIIYFLETDKSNQILKNFMNTNITDPIVNQSFVLKSDSDLSNFTSFANNRKEEMGISHKDNETKMSPPPVLVYDDEHHNQNMRDNKKHSPKRHHPNKPLVKLNCQDSCNNSIVPEISREVPTERKRRKRRKKNHRVSSCPQNSHNNNNNNNSTIDKMSLETTNKKKRRKYKKRQRNYDRDTKSEWLSDQTKTVDATQNSVQTTTICEKLFGNRNEQTKICVSFKKLPPSIPLPTPFIFPHQQPQQATRQRQISECSNDSLEICFLDDCDLVGMVVDDDDDDYDEFDNGDYTLNTYRMQHRLCGNSEDSDETDSDSGFRDEKKVRFDLKPKIHVMRTWDFAHRQARIGEWETLARDRVRFTDRIKKLDTIIAPILSKEHRDKIFLNRFM